MLRRIFGPKRDGVTREWRILHNEELYHLFSFPIIVRVIKWRTMRWAGHEVHMGERRGVYRVLVGKPEGNKPYGRPRRRWENNIKIDLREVGLWHGLDLSVSDQEQMAGCCESGNEPSGSIKWEEFLALLAEEEVSCCSFFSALFLMSFFCSFFHYLFIESFIFSVLLL